LTNISIVRGYKKDEIEIPGLKVIDNDKWQSTRVVYSLSLAASNLEQPYLVLYGDVFFKRYLLRIILDRVSDRPDADVVLVCVKENYISNGFSLKLSKCLDNVFDDDDAELDIVEVCADGESNAEKNVVYFSGLMLINNHSAVRLLLNADDIENLHFSEFLRRAINSGLKIAAILSTLDAIVDINSIDDLMKAGEVNA